MSKKIWDFGIFIFAVAITLCIGTVVAKADGGIFYPRDYYTAETSQKAFIYFANSTENMVVLSTFKGNAKDFAWVIPTPSQPEINKSSTDLFNNLAEITKTADSGPIVYNQPTFGLSDASKSTPVEVISEKTVDMYDTAVLKATDEKALAKWLTDHGYTFPADQTSALKSYVDGGWYFAIAKIKPDLIMSGGIVQELPEGTLTPLRLTFQSNKIIYPMKLTGLALTQAVPATLTESSDNPIRSIDTSKIPITLYILADHKTEHGSLETDWANWINKTKIKSLNDNLGGNIISSDKLFLTKMSNTLNVKDISDDFVIGNASNDQVHPTPVYKTAGFWLENLLFLFLTPLFFIFFPVPFGLIFLVFTLLQYYVKKKWLYILGSIYEILTCTVPILFGVMAVLAYSDDLNSILLQSGLTGALFSAVIIEIVIIWLTVKMIKRYKITFTRT